MELDQEKKTDGSSTTPKSEETELDPTKLKLPLLNLHRRFDTDGDLKLSFDELLKMEPVYAAQAVAYALDIREVRPGARATHGFCKWERYDRAESSGHTFCNGAEACS